MISRWLARRRDRAAGEWHWARRHAHAEGSPMATDPDVIRARRRLHRADALLDWWTANGTRR